MPSELLLTWDAERCVVTRTGKDEADPAALETLYQFAPALRNFCRTRVPNPADAEDTCHETLLRALRCLPRFRDGAPLWPWLRVIAGRVCADSWRSQARLDAFPGAALHDTAGPTPDEAIERAERATIVRRGFAEIDARARRYLYLREVEGWSYARLGTLEGRSGSAIRGLVVRARRRLRQRVEIAARRQGS